jgi:hypothetical protein
MGEQANYRPPGWQAGTGRPSLDALETALGTARGGTARGNEPGSDDAHARQPEAGAPRSSTNPEPSWPAVMATTVRLRLRRGTPGRLVRRHRVAALIVLAVTALVASGLAVSLTRQASTAPAAGGKAAQAGAAATWVVRQVSRDAVVGCDPGMCRLLRTHGFPAGGLLVLGPGAPGLRLCDVIVATQAAGKVLGSRLEAEYAPAVIAGFGSGRARIDIRAVAPRGATAYPAALAADWAARRKAAAQLVTSLRIQSGAAARQELLTGQVDSRLLITLAALAVSYPVHVVSFGDDAPGAAAGMPLREMEIAGTGSPADRAAELRQIRSSLLAQHSVFLPAHVNLVRLAGGAALRIEFGAPSPLGLLIGRPVTQ